jgi:hypothetical protein
MAYAEDALTQAANKNKIGVIKLGNVSQFSKFGDYLSRHPGSEAGKLIPLKSVKFGYDTNTYPKNSREAAERRKLFKEAKREWTKQILDQFKRLDKTKPLVLHFGNHGFNPGGKSAEESSPMCMYSSVSSASQCLTYREIGDLLTEAGLTGPNAPPIRLIGDHCYSGGIHSISMRFPNVCSASNVSYKTTQSSSNESFGAEDAINTFGQTFWSTVSQNGASNISLAESFQSAWSVVPKANEPGGTLSSVFYAQQIMGWNDRQLPTESRLPDLAAMEKNLNAAEDIYSTAQLALEGRYGIDPFVKPQAACYALAPKPLTPPHWESILRSLILDSGINVYREAVVQAKNPQFYVKGKRGLENLNQCWKTAEKEYQSAEPAVQEYIEKNGNWAWKNIFRSKSTIAADNSKFERSQSLH